MIERGNIRLKDNLLGRMLEPLRSEPAYMGLGPMLAATAIDPAMTQQKFRNERSCWRFL
jgi:hypothetical protein